MVLAAGFGTRLRPLTLTTPKPLLPVADKPFLDHLLALLHAGGIREVVINLHHLGHLIEQHVGDGARFGLRVRYSREETILDTAGGIKHAEALLAGEPFVVVNGDSVLEVSLADIAEFHRASAAHRDPGAPGRSRRGTLRPRRDRWGRARPPDRRAAGDRRGG
jgi:NDP-sugar pyrophosphorylase family protein